MTALLCVLSVESSETCTSLLLTPYGKELLSVTDTPGKSPTSGTLTPPSTRMPTDSTYFMSFDPGEKNTGWASFNRVGELTGNGTLRGLRGVSDFIWGVVHAPRVIICETYRVRLQHLNHQNSTVPTIRVIGVLEDWAYRADAEWVEQEAGRHLDGMRWAGIPRPSGHVPDNISAMGHGVYYLHKVANLWKIKL